MNNFSFVIQADESSALELQLGRFIPTQATNAAASAAAAAQSVLDAQGVLASSLLKANNLSDLASASVALSNLGGLSKASNLSDVANATTARGNLSAAKSGSNSDITSLSGLTTALSVSQGGTGATTVAGARTALGVPSIAGDTFTGDIHRSGAAGTNRQVIFDTAGLARWGIIGANLASESGSNAGSDFALSRYNDAGSYVDSPLLASRASGIVTLAQRPVFVDKTPWDNGNLANPMTLDTSQTVTGAKTFSNGLILPDGITLMGVSSGKNRIINGDFRLNQRGYASGTATTAANQYTFDRWRVVTSGQSLTFAASANGNLVTAPAGGVEQVIEGNNLEGGTFTLSWTGTATATVNGSAVAKNGQVTLAANTNATVRFSGGTVGLIQLEAGSAATPFDRRPYGQELGLCQRYFEVGNQPFLFMSGLSGVTAAYGDVRFSTAKRAAPSITCTGWQYFSGGANTGFTPTSITVLTDVFRYQGLSLTSWTGWAGAGTWTASAEL
jgi:hypothetical protein